MSKLSEGTAQYLMTGALLTALSSQPLGPTKICEWKSTENQEAKGITEHF